MRRSNGIMTWVPNATAIKAYATSKQVDASGMPDTRASQI
jgi:hypothetical protein